MNALTTQQLAEADRRHLTHAARLSRERMEQGLGGPFGAVIVDAAGAVVAEGWNLVTTANDPTAHAEVTAIRRACEALGTFDLSGHTIYSSCEPCPMCLAAVYWARLSRLVFANTRAEAAAIGFDDALIYDEIPKPIGERLIPTTHMPVAEASDAFAAWMNKADKVPY
jgi:tRNA(Arg) A34 adenosine deaminase TadA